MALTANTVPSQVPFFATPYDAQLAFTTLAGQNLTATGDYNNGNTQLDLGGSNPVSAAGRTDGLWCFDVTVADFSSGDETYKLHLLGSNDVAFGNGNVELLAFHDLAAVSAGRQIPTLMGATPAIPPTNLGGTLFQIPFTNLMQRIVYRFVRMRLVAGGTTPSLTLVGWLSRGQIHI